MPDSKDMQNRYSVGGFQSETYLIPISMQVIVGQVSAPLSPDRVVFNVVLLTADAGNAGTIYIGGPGCSLTTGQPLLPGTGIMLSASSPIDPHELMMGLISLVRQSAGLSLAELEGAAQRRAVLNLADFSGIATVAAQSLRILYFSSPRL